MQLFQYGMSLKMVNGIEYNRPNIYAMHTDENSVALHSRR